VAEEAVIRIRFEGDGGAQTTAVSVPRPTTQVPPPPPLPPTGTPPAAPAGAPTTLPNVGAMPKLPDMVRELDQFWKELAELNAAMDPDIVRQRVEQELALADARRELNRVMEEEREYQRPTAIPVPEPAGEQKSGLDRFLDMLGSFRGTIGARLGPTAGGGLDILQALRGMKGLGGQAEAGEGAEMGGEAAGVEAGAAGGPIGILVALAAMEVAKAEKDLAEATADASNGLQQFAAVAMSASADVGATLQGLGGGVASMGEAVEKTSSSLNLLDPLLGMLADKLGAGVKIFGQVLEVLGNFTQAIDQIADRYSAYSPEISVAQALADVSQTLGDLRRAQEIGPEMAQFINEESKLRQQFENEKIKILRAILPFATDAMRLLNDLMPFLDMGFKPILALLDAIHQFMVARGWAQANQPDTDFDLPGLDIMNMGAGALRGNREGVNVSPVE